MIGILKAWWSLKWKSLMFIREKTRSQQRETNRKEWSAMVAAFQNTNAYETTSVLENTLRLGVLILCRQLQNKSFSII